MLFKIIDLAVIITALGIAPMMLLAAGLN